MDYATTFVNEFCNQLSRMEHGRRGMISWYLFHDKRPGTVTERFELDASDYAKYAKLFQP